MLEYVLIISHGSGFLNIKITVTSVVGRPGIINFFGASVRNIFVFITIVRINESAITIVKIEADRSIDLETFFIIIYISISFAILYFTKGRISNLSKRLHRYNKEHE
jgi:hypothetical protein